LAESQLTIQEQIDQINKELLNLRNSHDGLTYGSGGGNVRTVGVLARNAFRNTESLDRRLDNLEIDLDYLRENLDELVNVEGVDGLEYKNNMLFLTKKGEKILPGVKIVAGSGSSGTGTLPSTMEVTIENLKETNTFNISTNQSMEVLFRFTSKDGGELTGDCSCTLYRNTVIKETFSIKNGEETHKDITKYLTTGRNEMIFECSDIYGNKKPIQYIINVISLEISSNFNDGTIITTDSFDFIYSHSGDVDKEIHFILGSGTNKIHITKQLTTSDDKQQVQPITSLSHGSYPLEVYATATVSGDNIESNHLLYEPIFKDEGVYTPIIASCFHTKEVKQGSLISIPFVVYDPQASSCDIILRVSYYNNGELVKSDTKRTVDYTKQSWDIRNVPVGTVTFSIMYEKLGISYVRSHEVKIAENNINIKPATSGLELFLSAEGRSNTEEHPDSWNYGNISTTFTAFNWGTNGWLIDDNGNTCLRLNGDAQIEIDIKPFLNDFKSTGKTIEFEFAVKNINKRDAVIIDCFDSEGNQVGIQASADKMFFKSTNDSVFCNYTTNKRTRVGFTVQNSNDKRFLCVYLDGVLSGIKQYATGDSFAQTNAQTIKIGSTECGIDLYSIRSYNLCLDDKAMTNNYIADIPNIIEKMDVYGDNDLYINGKLSYKLVKKKIPTVTFVGKMPTYKGDKKKKSVRMIFEHPTKPQLNFDEILEQIDVQGTSSAGYVRKNWKTKHSKAHTHMEGELPAKVFCLKVDYAEGTGTHNTQNANLIEMFYDDLPIPPMDVPEDFDLSGRNLSSYADISKVRTTITGFPICIFHLDTDDVQLIRNITIANLESGEYNVVFSSKGNFNYDKDAEDVFAFNKDYDVECWEFLKNEDPQSFLTPWPDQPLDYWEARYHPRLGELEDLQDAKNEVAAKALGDEMLSRFKIMYEWVHSTARGTYNGAPQATGQPLENTYVDKLGNSHLYDNDDYRLAKFRDEFENYFNLDYSAIYYVYTFFALMVDQRAKNMFLTYWRDDAYGPNDETNPGRWYPYFYDNDTSYGISNKGHLDFDYYHQDTDTLNGSNVYNGAHSVLWCNFRDAFPAKIQQTYAKLRSENKISYDKIIDQFVNKGSDQWSAAIYNQDADYKYISVSEDEVDGQITAYPYLFQVRGNGEQHLEYFVNNRIKFCDSKWKCGDFLNNTAMVNIYNPTSGSINLGGSEIVRPPRTRFELIPFSRMYYAVQYGLPSGDDPTKGMISHLAEDTETPLVFESETLSTNVNDFETYIYGASDISSLGDLSYFYPKQVNISKCVNLLELILGCREVGPNGETYCNPNLSVITTGNNVLLQKVDVSNCPKLTGDLNLSGCINIKEIYADGSGITSLSLPNGGYVNKLVLPRSFNNLILKGQQFLKNEGIILNDPTSLLQLNIDNCKQLDVLSLLEQCKNDSGYTVKFLRLTNVDLGTVTYDYLMNTLGKIGGIDENDSTYVATVDRAAYLDGKCKIENLTGEQLANIKRLFPYLTVYYDSLTLNITFKDELGQTILYGPINRTFEAGNSSNGITLDCPVNAGKIAKPLKDSTAQYDFIFDPEENGSGWALTPGGEPNITALRGIFADTVLYVAFTRILRSYDVKFYVGDTTKPKEIVPTYYGYDAIYPGTPKMPGVSNPDMYTFVGWAPTNENIDGERSCYAQFIIDEDSSSIDDYAISEFEYTLNETNKTITLNKANVIENTGRIKDSYNINEEYTVTAIESLNVDKNGTSLPIGCFSEVDDARTDNLIYGTNKITPGVTHNIEYVVLPDTLIKIGYKAFDNCKSLLALTIPKNVNSIHTDAFTWCESLATIAVDENNEKYRSENNCVIDKNNNSVVLGSISGSLPSSGITSIASNAFWGRKPIQKVEIPEGVTTIGSGAFCECNQLSELSLPNTVSTLNYMCFYKTNLSTVTIPSSVTHINQQAFANITSLTKVVIKQSDPSKINLYNNVFEGCGSNLKIYVPWSKDEYDSAHSGNSNYIGEASGWGNTNATIIYNYKGD